MRALFADGSDEARDALALQMALHHVDSYLDTAIDQQRMWYAFYSVPNDFLAWTLRYFDDNGRSVSERSFHVLQRYERAHAIDATTAERATRALAIVASRGGYDALFARTESRDDFLRRMTVLVSHDLHDPRTSLRIALDAYAFDRYLHVKNLSSDPRKIFSDLAMASRKSPELRGWSNVMRRRATARDDALELAAVQLEFWRPGKGGSAPPTPLRHDDDDDSDDNNSYNTSESTNNAAGGLGGAGAPLRLNLRARLGLFDV